MYLRLRDYYDCYVPAAIIKDATGAAGGNVYQEAETAETAVSSVETRPNEPAFRRYFPLPSR